MMYKGVSDDGEILADYFIGATKVRSAGTIFAAPVLLPSATNSAALATTNEDPLAPVAVCWNGRGISDQPVSAVNRAG